MGILESLLATILVLLLVWHESQPHLDVEHYRPDLFQIVPVSGPSGSADLHVYVEPEHVHVMDCVRRESIRLQCG
jgi:hypothetical protein